MRLAIAALLVLAGPAAAVGVLDAGSPVLRGTATDQLERTFVLDLWDAGEAPRVYTLRQLPDGDALAAEARARPVHGANATWKPLADFRLEAGPDKKAEDRGWDGVYEVAVRTRLPNQPTARLALLLAPAEGPEGLALTTRFDIRPLAIEAWRTADGAVAATLDGGKVPLSVEAVAGAQRWPLRLEGAQWRAQVPASAEVRVVARFADGGVLEGPLVAPRGAPVPAPMPAPMPARPSASEVASAPSAAPSDEPAGSPEAPAQRAAPHAAPQERASAASPLRGAPGPPISVVVGLVLLAGALGARRL